MDNSSFKIVRVSEQPPRQWDGPNGTIFYHKVMLEGHAKPVSLGKKTADKLQVGETVFGNITADPVHDEDKFKPTSKPFTPGGGSKGGYNGKTKEEQDSIYRSVALNNAIQLGGPGIGKLDEVLLYAEAFYGWLKRDDSPEPSEPKEETKGDF